MEMQQENGKVLACLVENCSWWQGRQCHASQIRVGDLHPTCDTFTTNDVQQTQESEPGVGACMIQDCKFNSMGQQCNAPGITVGHHAEHADCDTYVPGD